MRNLVNTRFVTAALMTALPRAEAPRAAPRAPEPRAFVSVALDYPGGRMDWYEREAVKVTHIKHVARRFRFARVEFEYTV